MTHRRDYVLQFFSLTLPAIAAPGEHRTWLEVLRITHHTPRPKTQQRCSYAGSGYVLVGGRGVDEAEGIIKREVKRGGRVLASPKSITRDCGAEKVPCPISCFISKWKCDYRETLPGNITSSPITYSYQE